MIIIHLKGVNTISQSIYDQMINLLDLLLLTCPCCKHIGTVSHAYYDRDVKEHEEFRLVVLRVKCKFCGKTHAILPDTLVPYSSITLRDTVTIVLSDCIESIKELLMDNINLDLEDVRRVRRNFRLYWKERLLSFDVTIDNSISRKCIELFHRQFMQIHCTICGSYDQIHI